MLPITLSYEGLAGIDISEKLMWHPEIICKLPGNHVNSLKANWSKHDRYWKSSMENPSSCKTAFLGFSWILHRAKLGFSLPNLEPLISAYTRNGYMMEPVEFEGPVDGLVKMHIRRKGRGH